MRSGSNTLTDSPSLFAPEPPPPHRPDAADYELERAPVTVRLIRVVTPEGLIRVLATSLLDANRWPAVEFGALYHQRWRVEEAFRRIKHRIDLESVSGLSWLAHQQDLAAKILCDNLNALLCLEALGERDGHISDDAPTVLQTDGNAWLKINRTRAFGMSGSACPDGCSVGSRLPMILSVCCVISLKTSSNLSPAEAALNRRNPNHTKPSPSEPLCSHP